MQAVSGCCEWGLRLIVVRWLVITVASFVGHRLSGTQPSVVVAPGRSCSTAGGIFPDHGSKSVSPAPAWEFLSTVPPGKSRGAVLTRAPYTQIQRQGFLWAGGGRCFRSRMTNRTEQEEKANYHDAFGMEIFLLLVSQGSLEGELNHWLGSQVDSVTHRAPPGVSSLTGSLRWDRVQFSREGGRYELPEPTWWPRLVSGMARGSRILSWMLSEHNPPTPPWASTPCLCCWGSRKWQEHGQRVGDRPPWRFKGPTCWCR